MDDTIKLFIGCFVICFWLFVAALWFTAATWIAPLLIFLMKAGWLWQVRYVPVLGDILEYFAFDPSMGIPGYVLFLGVITIASFGWQLYVIETTPAIGAAYYSAYGSKQEFFSAWTSMLRREFLPFAIAVAVTVTTQACMPMLRGTRLLLIARICFLVFAALVFTAVLYPDDFFTQATSPLAFISKLASRLTEEIYSSFALIWALLVGAHGSFNEWLTNEMVKMKGSLFRVSSLYPKIFWVLILGSLIGGLFRSGASEGSSTGG
jgi:hypothetical protein